MGYWITDDPFIHMVEEVRSDGGSGEQIAGANNIFAARRAFDELLAHFNPPRKLRLREGPRIIREANCTGERC